MRCSPKPWKVWVSYSTKILEIQDKNGKAVIAWPGFDSANQPFMQKVRNAELIVESVNMKSTRAGKE